MKNNISSMFKDVIKSLLLSLVFTTILVIFFAFLMTIFSVDDTVIKIVNIFIKYVSVFLGIFIAYKEYSKGWIKGLILGVLYSLSLILIYAFISKEINFKTFGLIDILSIVLVSIIVSIFKVNISSLRKVSSTNI